MVATGNDDASSPHEEKKSIPLFSEEKSPPFYDGLHVKYVTGLADRLDAPDSYEGALTEHLRVSGVYWSLAALRILRSEREVDRLMGVTSPVNDDRECIVDWVYTCYDAASGGFGGNAGHEGHLLYTLSAIQVLLLADQLETERFQKIQPAVVDFVAGLQQPDGSFAGDASGEIDTRFTYCALSSLSILGQLDRVDVKKAADYVLACRNMDGGFGSCVGAESHAGQVFCCVGALSIACALDGLREEKGPDDVLGWWLAERQVDSGGLNGRPEKQADVCYSWWILSALSILGKVSYINADKLAGYILRCQDDQDGGIADRPDDMPDVFHTFFGVAGLSLTGHLHRSSDQYRTIDPVYALPTDIVRRRCLKGQVMAIKADAIEERLKHYDVVYTDD